MVQRERRFWRPSQSMTKGCCWPLLPCASAEERVARRSSRCLKAYHQIVSVSEDNDDREVRIPSASDVQCRNRRRLDPSTRIVSGKPFGTKQKPPAQAGGSCSCIRIAAYRLAWRLAPPLAAVAWLLMTSPLETSFTQSEP